MYSQTFFQILIFAGIGLTAVGGIGSHFAGKAEADKKEQAAQERIDELQTALTMVIEQNSQLVAESTKETIEKEATKQRRDDALREARKKRDEKRRTSSAQQKATKGH
jgi:hypothetical protein